MEFDLIFIIGDQNNNKFIIDYFTGNMYHTITRRVSGRFYLEKRFYETFLISSMIEAFVGSKHKETVGQYIAKFENLAHIKNQELWQKY